MIQISLGIQLIAKTLFLVSFQQKKQNWFYFVRSRLPNLKQSRKINKIVLYFLSAGLLASIKKIFKIYKKI